jgi:cobaltochelatase CobT
MPTPDACAFLSYARIDDQHERGHLSRLRERLSGEVQVQTGEPFPIFQDLHALRWGDPWSARLTAALDGTCFLIPVLTPSFFRSTACRREVGRFLHRERREGYSDRILPIYWVDSWQLADPVGLASDPLARALAGRQWADWRSLRLESPGSARWDQAVAEMATAIRARLARRSRTGG